MVLTVPQRMVGKLHDFSNMFLIGLTGPNSRGEWDWVIQVHLSNLHLIFLSVYIYKSVLLLFHLTHRTQLWLSMAQRPKKRLKPMGEREKKHWIKLVLSICESCLRCSRSLNFVISSLNASFTSRLRGIQEIKLLPILPRRVNRFTNSSLLISSAFDLDLPQIRDNYY